MSRLLSCLAMGVLALGLCISTAHGGAVAVGSSQLIDVLDYSDTLSDGTFNRPEADGTYPPPAEVMLVENCYSNPGRSFPGDAFSHNKDANAYGGGANPFPGTSGAGSDGGFTQTGYGDPKTFGIPYSSDMQPNAETGLYETPLRDSFAFQLDAVQTSEWVGLVLGKNASYTDPDNLFIHFCPSTDTDPGAAIVYRNMEDVWGTMVAELPAGTCNDNTWQNYGVALLPNNELKIYLNETLLADVDLASVDGYAWTGAGAGDARTGIDYTGFVAPTHVAFAYCQIIKTDFRVMWTDNWQIGTPSEYVTGGGTTDPLPGDLDGDGLVGSADLDIVRANWGQTVTAGDLLAGDPSADGQVGSADLDIVRANWGNTAAAAVPEPTGFVLMACGFLALALGWRKK